MTTYQRRQDPVYAFQFANQPKTQWPDWMQSYRVHGAYGEQPIHENLGSLVVPTKGAGVIVGRGDWIVLEGATNTGAKITGGDLGVYRAGEFENAFEEAPEVEAAEDEPLPPVAEGEDAAEEA